MTIDYSLYKVVVIEYELNGNTLKTHKYEHAFINVIMIKKKRRTERCNTVSITMTSIDHYYYIMFRGFLSVVIMYLMRC